MTDEVVVCNQALGWLGAQRITSLKDESNEAKLCQENYQHLRDALLTERAWTFADASLTLTAPIPSDWANGDMRYLLPTNVLRVYRVYKDVSTSRPITLPKWRREGGYIVAPYSGPIYLQATIRETDLLLWLPAARQALAARIAADLAIPITRSRQLQVDMWALYEAKLEAAGAADATQARSERTDSTELVSARYGDGLSRG